MRVIQRTQGMRQGMHGAQAALECGGAHAGCHQHLLTRLQVGPVRDRPGQVFLDQAHALECDAGCHGMEERRAIGLEVVRQRIHAGGGGDSRRQSDGELGVQDHDGRQHARMENDALNLRGLVGDDGRAPYFRTRPRRRRHGHHGRHAGHVHAQVVVADIFEVPQGPVLARHQGDGLCGVQRRAASERDHAVVAPALERGNPMLDIGTRRVALDVVEHGAFQAGLAAGTHCVGDHRQCGQARIGHQQWARHAQFAAPLREFAHAAGTGLDGGWVVPVDGGHSHGSISPGVASDAAHMEGFGLRELLVSDGRQRYAAARILDARPGERRIQIVAAIHEKCAGPDLPADMQRGLFVPGEHGGCQPVGAIVHQRNGLLIGIHRHDAHDRTKAFVVHDAHAVVDLSQQRWRDIRRAFTRIFKT
ncbi:hypothetical protein D3C72_1165330 [compost metagenome]